MPELKRKKTYFPLKRLSEKQRSLIEKIPVEITSSLSDIFPAANIDFASLTDEEKIQQSEAQRKHCSDDSK